MALEFRLMLFVIFILASLVIVLITAAIPAQYFWIKLPLGIVAIALNVLAVSTRYFTYLYEPLTRMKKRTIVIDDGEPYIMAPSGNAIVRREKEKVFATVFVKIPVYSSATEMEDQEKLDFAVAFSKMLSIMKEPFRITTQLYVLNKDEYVDKIRARLNDVQDKYNTMLEKEAQAGQQDKGVAPPGSNRLRGELTMWKNMLENVNRARGHSLSSFAAISATGGTEEEAINLALMKGDELASGISATYGIAAGIATNSEILELIEPEKNIPVANVSQSILEKSAGMS